MKKEFIFSALIFLVLFSTFVYAEETPTTPQTPQETAPTNLADLTTDTAKIQQTTDAAKQEVQKTLSQEIEMPEYVEKVFKIIFNLKSEEPLTLQKFIVMLSLLIIFILLLQQFASLIFKETLPQYIAGTIAALLIVVGGGANKLTDAFFWVADLFNVLTKYSFLRLIFAIALSIILFFGLRFLLKLIKESIEISRAVNQGVKEGLREAKQNARAKMQENLDGSGI